MKAFAELLDRLYYTSSHNAKQRILCEYLEQTPDPDRGWAIAAIAGTLNFDLFKRKLIKDLMSERIDPILFELSYDYVGELSETVAHLWPASIRVGEQPALPTLTEVVTRFSQKNKTEIEDYLTALLDVMTPSQRWALVKLGTRGLRIGISARSLKKILAHYGSQHIEVELSDIEKLWHGLKPPYTELLQWLDGSSDKPDISDCVTFHPVMLSHPLEEKDLTDINSEHWHAEWKYDGIRIQLVATTKGAALFTRTGDDISHSFPDIIDAINFNAVVDGELLIKKEEGIGSFNQLQQRLNKKKPSRRLIEENPAAIMLYDALEINGEDITAHPLIKRRKYLADWYAQINNKRFDLSPLLTFKSHSDLENLRAQADRGEHNYIEGLMLKHKQSLYVSGRPKGQWYKWKRDPLLVDAVIMYAQRGHGKRSSYYSDYTFGLWQQNDLLPIGKAYSGFSDDELKKLDRWVRENTTNRFGPVREVAKELVFEVAFDSVHTSSRHKSGLALRFPRIHRIRWDKPACEADQLSSLQQHINH